MNSQFGKVVVFGGSSGIGLAAGKLLLARGYAVTIVGRDQAKLANASGGTALKTAAVDAQSTDSVAQFFNEIGAIDHLVITVSGAKGAGPFASVDETQLLEGFQAKFFAHWRIARASLGTLSKSGSITFVSAISARGSLPGTAGLAAINGAIEAMVRPLARELKPLRVNAVSPGVIETPWWDALPASQRDSLLQSSAAASAVGRNGRPDEVAEAIAFLVGNGFVTGTTIEIDGGFRLG